MIFLLLVWGNMDIPLLAFSSLYGLFVVILFTVGVCFGLVRQDNQECVWLVYTIIIVGVVCLLFIAAWIVI